MTVIRRALSLTLLVVVAFVASLVVTGRMRDANDAGAQNPAPAPAPVAPAGTAAAGAPTVLVDFTRIAERAVPAVVNISAQQVISRRYRDPLAEFFGRSGVRTQRGVSNAVGSGVIISSDGYILTNNHVVTGEPGQRGVTIEQLDVSITLSDKRELQAEVVGVDPATDLALLKVEATGLPTMPWGDSSKLKVAEWVLAIGNPYQLSESVSLGIVSAVGRTNLGVSTFEDFIQTDAAINPGNSGGALVNLRGELVGINTMIFSPSGGNVGLGFAIPSALATDVMKQLIAHGEVKRGNLGIETQALDAEIAALLDTDAKRGAVVVRVRDGSPAAQAGIEPGDIVTALDGRAIVGPRELANAEALLPVGTRVKLSLVRGRVPREVTA